MIFTDFYLFEKVTDVTKTRMVCTLSTRSYQEFEEKRGVKNTKPTATAEATMIGDLVLYVCPNNGRIGRRIQRQADYTISMGGRHLTSIFTPDLQSSWAYGDVSGTQDLLIMKPQMTRINGAIKQGGSLEIFIARGKASHANAVFDLVCDGRLLEEMEELRTKAQREQNLMLLYSKQYLSLFS